MEKFILTTCQEIIANDEICGQLAEVKDSYWLPSTDSERQTLHLVVCCINRHRLTTLVENYAGDPSDLLGLPGPDVL